DLQRVLIKGRQRPDHAAEYPHRVSVTRKAVVKQLHVLVQHRVVANVLAKSIGLLACGQLPIHQQVSRLEKIAVLGERLDRVAAVTEDTFFTIEERDRAASAAGVDVSF